LPERGDLPYLDDSQYNDLIGKCRRDKRKALIYEYIQPKEKLEEDIFKLILKCLSYNPLKRPKLSELLVRVQNIINLTVEKKPLDTDVQSNKILAYTGSGETKKDQSFIKNPLLPYIRDISDIENNKKLNKTDIHTFRPVSFDKLNNPGIQTKDYSELIDSNIY
jgi:serine/threonine protein kinase